MAQPEILSEFSLVRKISAFLKLGETGKLESFFQRVIKTLSKEISAHKKNLDTLKFNYTQEIEDIDDEIQDAQVAYEESFMKVDIDKIGTNEAQKDFQEVYLANIDAKAIVVENLKKKKGKVTEAYEDAVKDTQEQIDSLTKRVEAISAKQ